MWFPPGSNSNNRKMCLLIFDNMDIITVSWINGVDFLSVDMHGMFFFSFNGDCKFVLFGPVRIVEKTSRNTVLADLLREKNTVPTKKTSRKVRIIREANMTKGLLS